MTLIMKLPMSTLSIQSPLLFGKPPPADAGDVAMEPGALKNLSIFMIKMTRELCMSVVFSSLIDEYYVVDDEQDRKGDVYILIL